MRTGSWGRHTARCVARARVGLVLGAAALIVSGCASAPAPVPSETPAGAAPVFASDEEALAAATEAYAAYLQASDDSWTGKGASREEFLALSTGKAHIDDIAAAELFSKNGWRIVGTTEFDSIRVQSVDLTAEGDSEVRTYLCLDVTASDVVDSAGASVAKEERPLRMPLEVAFVTESPSRQNLLVSESEVWSGSNFC